jgi:homoserine acetyltransferase
MVARMFTSLKFAPVLLGLAFAQDAIAANSTTYDVVPTPDAVPVDFLRDVEVPTYTINPGLDSDIIYYASETAIQAAAAQQTESPLSVFVSSNGHLLVSTDV